jgi:hypothetical protein
MKQIIDIKQLKVGDIIMIKLPEGKIIDTILSIDEDKITIKDHKIFFSDNQNLLSRWKFHLANSYKITE